MAKLLHKDTVRIGRYYRSLILFTIVCGRCLFFPLFLSLCLSFFHSLSRFCHILMVFSLIGIMATERPHAHCEANVLRVDLTESEWIRFAFGRAEAMLIVVGQNPSNKQPAAGRTRKKKWRRRIRDREMRHEPKFIVVYSAYSRLSIPPNLDKQRSQSYRHQRHFQIFISFEASLLERSVVAISVWVCARLNLDLDMQQ